MCKVHYFCRQIKDFYQIVIFPETYGAPVSQMHSKVDHALYADSYFSFRNCRIFSPIVIAPTSLSSPSLYKSCRSLSINYPATIGCILSRSF